MGLVWSESDIEKGWDRMINKQSGARSHATLPAIFLILKLQIITIDNKSVNHFELNASNGMPHK